MKQRTAPVKIHVYEDTNLTRQLRILEKGGGNATAAALHARAIIDRLVEAGTCSPKLMGRLTRRGEARIRDCIKFDLVRRYRLIGVMRDQQIIFLYVGSHGECDVWIRNNSGLNPILNKRRNRVFEAIDEDGNRNSEGQPVNDDGSEADDFDQVMGKVSDGDLRSIFSGLCGK